MTSRGVRKPNCVVHDLARSPLSTQLWPPTMRSRRRRRPSVLGIAPRCQPATIPVRGDTCRWASARAVVAVQVASPGRCRRSAPMTASQSKRDAVGISFLDPSPQPTQLTGQAPLDVTTMGDGQIPIYRQGLIPGVGWRPPGGHHGTPCPQPPVSNGGGTILVGRRVAGVLG